MGLGILKTHGMKLRKNHYSPFFRTLIPSMINIRNDLAIADLTASIDNFWNLSGQKILDIESNYDLSKGAPVYTVNGKYTTRGWTEWTQGFQFGSSILQFDATGEERFLNMGRQKTVSSMAPHISHTGVHDHGFNNVSTYGNLLRLMKEGKIAHDEWQQNFYELALKISGAIQAARWTPTRTGGYIYSFNGPHSLFVDTIRSCRSLMVSHLLGHVLQGENDIRINLLERSLQHLHATAHFSVYYGEGRDSFDVRGRTAHESIFNVRDGHYRCPNSQQGYSGFTTWTRGLAWAMCGFAEELEFLNLPNEHELDSSGGSGHIEDWMIKAATATCDFYIQYTPTDGVPYWDTGAPNLYKLGNYLDRSSDPYNQFEPVDSSAAAIGAQGLLRLGRYLQNKGNAEAGNKYWQAGLTVVDTLLREPYLSMKHEHQGILLHSVYHWPNGWDHVPQGASIPQGESSMWGDYHIREVVLYLQKILRNEPYYSFFNCAK
jgi:unsaturated chondroitin disaccharide hydrolase